MVNANQMGRPETPIIDELRSVVRRIDEQGIQQEFIQEEVDQIHDRLDVNEDRMVDIKAKLLASESLLLSVRLS